MHPPLWKYYLSFLTEVHVESAPSEHNPHLYVSLRKGRYQLSTANAIYSYADLYSNFRDAFQQIRLPDLPIDNVLLLGFGLGSIPYMLEKKFQLDYHYTAVEIDENVLYLANKYVLPDLTSSISMIASDANIFVAYCQEQFDLICMDIFLDDTIPAIFETEAFLLQLKNLLTPNGILLFNKLALTQKDIAACQSFRPLFLSCFPEGTHLEVDGNWMFLNRKEVINEKK